MRKKLKILFFITALIFLFLPHNAQSLAAQISDGDLLTTKGSFDIYIVKLVGAKKFKRLILNPAIFNSYGHLKWENVKTVSGDILNEYVLSEFVIEVNADGTVFDPKVYKVSSAPDADSGERRWINISAQEFESLGYDWDSIYQINRTEAAENFYSTKPPLTYEALRPAVPIAEKSKVISFSSPDCNLEVPTSHASIQSAIDAAKSGDKICVLAGTYKENVKIDGKDLMLFGAGAAAVKIMSVGENAVVIKNVSALTLVENIMVTSAKNFGIWLDSASPVIKNNIFQDNFAGIRVFGSSRPNIHHNLFLNNTHGAIVHNGDVGEYLIDHNTFVDNGNIGGKAAVLLDAGFTASQIRITNNIFSGGVLGIHETVPSNSVINNNLFYGQSENYVRKMRCLFHQTRFYLNI